MTSFTIARLNKEINQLLKNAVPGIIIEKPENILSWKIKMLGPENSSYENGIFDMMITFNEEYPIKAPSVKFLTPMYHPNIYRDGKICIDILQPDGWSAIQKVETILISIRSLLTDPNPSSPANREAAELYVNDIKKYDTTVREFIEKNKN
jgi:ubiquitin-conjugating enzyme E2 A